MKTILIIDDEERIRRIFGALLVREGYRALDAASPVEANRIMTTERIDCILLDINLPQLQGDLLFDVIQAFHRDIKVIVTSVLPLDDQRRLVNGAADYYDKSESMNVLKEKVKNVLGEDRKRKIAIIDDDPHIRILYRNLFVQAGYHPVTMGDAKEAFDFLKKELKDIDLILLDIAMPHISGLEFFDMIKKECPNTKVLVSSVFTEDQQKYFVFNADDYFDKSTGNAALLKKVEQLVGA